MSLAEAPKDTVLKVVFIDSGDETKRKLSAMGIHLDNEVVKIHNPKWGPILIKHVEAGASKLAIGRRIAEKIKVTYE